MKATFKQYDDTTDFRRVRDLLAQTFGAFPRPVNWRIERWNYARYFVAPMLGGWENTEDPVAGGQEGIRKWMTTLGLWEDDVTGRIVGAVLSEEPRPNGEAFIQRRPGWDSLLPDMLGWAADHMAHPETATCRIPIYEYDQPLQAAAAACGFVENKGYTGYESVYTIETLSPCRLAEGYVIHSMADLCDVDLRREVFGRAFNHTDPNEWPSRFSYEELMRAPDYVPDQDLFVVAPDGRYVSCCIGWYDAMNRIGIMEPVGTHPEFRRRGLGREVVYEAIRRLAARGAREVWVGSGQPFYEAIGFKKRIAYRFWEKQN